MKLLLVCTVFITLSVLGQSEVRTHDYSKCQEVICVSEKVITKKNQIGKVHEIWGETASITIGGFGNSFEFMTSDLSPAVKSLKGISKGINAIKGGHLTRIEEVFKNGKVAYSQGMWANTFIGNIEEFSKEVDCIDNICKGDKIITSARIEIQLSNLFENGEVIFTRGEYLNNVTGKLRNLIE